MPVKKPKNRSIPKFITPRPLPPPDRNMYKRKENKDLPLPHQLPAPEFPLPSPYRIDSPHSTYNGSLPGTYSNNKTAIFPTANTLANFKTRSLTPSPMFTITPKKKLSMKRCKKGTRRNKTTMICEKKKYYARQKVTKRQFKRCPNGKRRNPFTLECESEHLFTRSRI